MTRKTKGSANYEKARIKVARLEKHIADSRKWWIENESLRLTKNYSTIGIEDLNLQGIAKFLRNAKNVTDCGYGIFVNRLIQKGEELGTSVIKVDRYFPSSQLCHCCGYQNHNLKLSDREWTCPNCGEHHIRDYNASINLKNEALSIDVRNLGLWRVLKIFNHLFYKRWILEHPMKQKVQLAKVYGKPTVFRL